MDDLGVPPFQETSIYHHKYGWGLFPRVTTINSLHCTPKYKYDQMKCGMYVPRFSKYLNKWVGIPIIFWLLPICNEYSQGLRILYKTNIYTIGKWKVIPVYPHEMDHFDDSC